jgi:hypothetical protein
VLSPLVNVIVAPATDAVINPLSGSDDVLANDALITLFAQLEVPNSDPVIP